MRSATRAHTASKARTTPEDPDSASVPNRERRIFVALVSGSAVSVLLLALALLFSGSYAAGRVAENAKALHWANATLGATAIARASNAQAVFFAVDRELGVASDDAAALAASEARTNLADLDAWLNRSAEAPGATTREIDAALAEYVALGDSVLVAVESGAVEEALDLNDSAAEPLYQEVRSALTAQQEVISEMIDQTERTAGLVGGIIRFAVTLLIPMIAILVYRGIARRQMQRREIELQAGIEGERMLGRAREDFIASISHEFRTPLTTIYGLSEVLVEDGLGAEGSEELVALINTEATDLSRMVEDLLTAARIDTGALGITFEDFSVADEIDAVVTPLRRTGIEIGLDSLPVAVSADRMRFRQLLRNLVANAHKHGGPTIRVVVRSDAERTRIRVSDDGPGVSVEMEERMFQRFVHRGEQPLLAGSVGLGLAVASSLAQAMGGELRYVRADGWTHFEVELARAASEVRTSNRLEGAILTHGAAGRRPGLDGVQIAASEDPASGIPPRTPS